MTSLNHLLRAFVLLALFVCLAQGCGKSESPTADPEPFKAAVAQYLEQNNHGDGLEANQGWPDHRRQDRHAHRLASACDHSRACGYLDVSFRAKRRRNLERGQSQVTYLLHGPTGSAGLTPDDWAAWRAMEAIHASGRTRMLGVSNFNLEQLQCLWQEARVRPRFVQNRCYALLGWDRPVREFCRANDVVYQGFSLLTANRQTLAAADLAQIAARYGRTIPQVVFRFAIEVGMIPLTGTTNSEHMQADLEVLDFRLEPAEVATIEGLGER